MSEATDPNTPPEAPQVPQPPTPESQPELTLPEELPSDGEQVRDGVEEAPNA